MRSGRTGAHFVDVLHDLTHVGTLIAGWLPVVRSFLPTVRKNLRHHPLSNLSSLWKVYQSKQPQRKSRKKYGYLRRRALWYQARGDQWAWISTKRRSSHSYVRLISRSFSSFYTSMSVVLLSITTCMMHLIMKYNVYVE